MSTTLQNPLTKEYKSRTKLRDIAVYLHLTNKVATGMHFDFPARKEDGTMSYEFNCKDQITQTKKSISEELGISTDELNTSLKHLGIKSISHYDKVSYWLKMTSYILKCQNETTLPFMYGVSLEARALYVLIKTLHADTNKATYKLSEDLGVGRKPLEKHLREIKDRL